MIDIKKKQMIAPCGINCGVCIGYLREKNRCVGCLSIGNKPAHCDICFIKNCKERKNSTYCYKCSKFACLRLKNLDKRYRLKYDTSLINNLKEIKSVGIRRFTIKDNSKWICEHCGNVISIHRRECLRCHKEYIIIPNYDLQQDKKL